MAPMMLVFNGLLSQKKDLGTCLHLFFFCLLSSLYYLLVDFKAYLKAKMECSTTIER